MIIHDCHCSYHFGDCVIALRLIHHLAQRHPERVWRMAVHSCHLPELQPLVDHQPNITLCAIETFGIQPRSIDLWKQAEKFWSTHPLKNDFAAFTKRYFRRLIREFGLNDPTPGLLFDFPCLGKRPPWPYHFDILLVNSNPQSAQFLDYTHEDSLDLMIETLSKKGFRVLTTKYSPHAACCTTKYSPYAAGCTTENKFRCFEIAQIANSIKRHIMVSTGPSWLTMNVFSKPSYRLLMIGNGEHVDLDGSTVNCKTIAQAMDELKRAGLI